MHVKYALLSSPHAIEFLETRLLLNVFRTQKILHQLTIQETLYRVSVSTYSSFKKKKFTSDNTKLLGQMLGPNPGSEKCSTQSGGQLSEHQFQAESLSDKPGEFQESQNYIAEKGRLCGGHSQ